MGYLNLSIPMVGLAKREEQIVVESLKSNIKSEGLETRANKLQGYIEQSDDFMLINLPHTGDIVKLIQRIRDESHRFGVRHHRTRRKNSTIKSELEEIPGIGEKAIKLLLSKLKSVKGMPTKP